MKVKGGLPTRFGCHDGYASDRTLNRATLGEVVSYLADKGFPGLKVCIVGNAMVNETNL